MPHTSGPPGAPPTSYALPELGSPLTEDDLSGGLPGVYLLLDGQRVVYVGQSSDLRLRVSQHRKDRKKVFDSALFYHIDNDVSRLRIEGILSLLYLPKYNHGFNLGLSAGKVWEIRWSRRSKKGAA